MIFSRFILSGTGHWSVPDKINLEKNKVSRGCGRGPRASRLSGNSPKVAPTYEAIDPQTQKIMTNA